MFGLLLGLDATDIAFLAGAFVVALVLVLISNPLTTWVNKLLNRDND